MSWLLYVMLGGLIGLLISAAILVVGTGIKLGVWATKPPPRKRRLHQK